MAWSKAITDDEVLFIKEAYGHMTVSSIAEKLGRSERSVYRVAKRLNLSAEADSRARESRVPELAEAEGQTYLQKLEELASVLRASLMNCDSRTLPKVATEYRATLGDIERAKGAGKDDGGGDELGALLGVIKLREA